MHCTQYSTLPLYTVQYTCTVHSTVHCAPLCKEQSALYTVQYTCTVHRTVHCAPQCKDQCTRRSTPPRCNTQCISLHVLYCLIRYRIQGIKVCCTYTMLLHGAAFSYLPYMVWYGIYHMYTERNLLFSRSVEVGQISAFPSGGCHLTTRLTSVKCRE